MVIFGASAVLVVVAVAAGAWALGGADPAEAEPVQQTVVLPAPASSAARPTPAGADADTAQVRAAPEDGVPPVSRDTSAATNQPAAAQGGPGATIADATERDTRAGADAPDWERLAQSVVQLRAPDCEQAGSGTIIGDGRLVLTNSHVLHADGGGPVCEVYAGFTRRFDEPPDDWLPAELVADDLARDLAVVRIIGTPADAHTPLQVARGQLALGDQLTILGYPGFGETQNTLTFTSGRFSGATTGAAGHRMLKTDALLDSGVSGGAAFDRNGSLIGVATGGFEGEGGTLGAVIPGAEVLRFLTDHALQAEAEPMLPR